MSQHKDAVANAERQRFLVRSPYSYLIAIGLSLVAFALRWAIDPMMDVTAPWVTYFVAVTLSAWWCGFRPAVLASVLGLLLGYIHWLPLVLESSNYLALTIVWSALYLSVTLTTAFFARTVHAARARMLERQADLEREVQLRTRSEEALRASEYFYRQTLESIPGMVFTTRPDGYCDYQSQQWVEFTGIPMDEHMGDGWNKLLHPDDRPAAFAAWRDAVEGRAPYDVEYRVRNRDGHYEWFKVRGRPIVDNAGRIVRWFGVATSIEDMKHSEEELRKLTDELKRSNEDLQQFAYVASHDLQEPLRMVSGFMSLLRKQYAQGLDEKAQGYIAHAVDGSERMQRLVRDLLEYSRITSRGKELRPVSMNAVFDRVTADLERRIAETQAVVTRDQLPEVLADETQMIQVLLNLLGNALKFRDPQRQPTVHVGVEARGDKWLFFVRDNGIGIEPESFKRLFMIFQRLHTRQAYEGTGIGLALVRKIIERHGGHVCVESEPNHGSTFYFTIPRRPVTGFAAP